MIRRAVVDDLAAIAGLQRQSPEAGAMLPDLAAATPETVVLVAEDGGTVVGYLYARLLGGSELELYSISVQLEQRRRGWARKLLQALLMEFPLPIYLEVRQSNAAALRLYESIGFQQLSVRRDYYPPLEDGLPRENAIVMVSKK